jgi:hypothetical protein
MNAEVDNLVTRSRIFRLNSSLQGLKEKLDPAILWQINRGVT